MRNFDYRVLKDKRWDNEILSYVAKIHEYKGKQEFYIKQKHIELDRLVKIATVQSTESSNRIEGIVTTSARLKKIMDNKATPRNRDEKEILGYRNVLNLIHENYKYIYLTPNYILQLHKELLKYTSFSYRGQFKTTQNEITTSLFDGTREVVFNPLPPYETPDAISNICEQYKNVISFIDPLILIPYFILDFLCIHPFNDGNGRMSRLLTLLLLYKNEYMVGKYISIEKAIADTKENYYDALEISCQNWHEGKNNPKEFIKYMLSIILYCYRDFETRTEFVRENKSKITSYDIVKRYVLNKIGLFTKREVLFKCPSLSSSSVEASLKKLVSEGIVKKIGSGKNTRYLSSISDLTNI